MTDVPIYTSRLEIASDPGPGIQPQALPPSGGGERIGEAVAGFGQAAGGIYEAMQKAQQHTKAATATAEYLTQLDGLEQQATKDAITDYQNAPKRFYDAQRDPADEAFRGHHRSRLARADPAGMAACDHNGGNAHSTPRDLA